jgi:peptidoglycan-associated lipoprotein
MHHKLLLSLIAVAALSLGACATTKTETPEIDDQSVGAEAAGAGTEGAAEGQALDAGGDLLSKRRVNFEYDSSAIDDAGRAIVEAHAAYLVNNKNIRVVLEGHADERGTREYNLALGERRAQSVERMFKLLGVSADRIKTVSYGEEKPIAMDHDQSAWALNRRVEILY